MPKRALVFTSTSILLDPNIVMPLYRQLYERLRTQILTGQLETEARLPSTRALASQLGVSRTTTALAYEMLGLEGYIESRVGAGAKVAYARNASKPSFLTEKRPPQPAATEQESSPMGKRGQAILQAERSAASFRQYNAAATRVFQIGEPDVANFPFDVWARLVASRARHSLPSAAHYQSAQGFLPLREAIAAHIGITRGVRCAPEQILITSGSQGALDLVARTLLDPGDEVWVEDPGYFGARGALLSAGACLRFVSVDREGLDVAEAIEKAPHARLAVVTPSHQFPTGVTMSLPRRVALLEWASEARAWIIEDDYDSEYRYSGRPLEALQGVDRTGATLYIGTFSKTLFPALRIGFLIAPESIVDGLLATRRFVDTHPAPLEQMALADFMTEGHYIRRLRSTHLLYQQRRDALFSALTEELGDILDVELPEAGLHLVGWLREGLPVDAIEQAGAAGLAVTLFRTLGIQKPPREGLLFGFANSTTDQLRTGVRLLKQILKEN